jgi:hypothetical protein
MGQAPSTQWRETIAPDEVAQHARLAAELRALHEAKNLKWGRGRFLHRKPVLAVNATMTVHDDLPEYARHGVFARPGRFRALVRLSNGSLDIQANTKPDIRGFAIRVLDVAGPAALGGEADHQDFLLINHDIFEARDSAEFMELAAALARGGELGVLAFLLKRYGLKDGLSRIRRTMKTLAKPFKGYAAERFTTAAPHANGDYAMKLRVTPTSPRPYANRDHATEMQRQVAAGPVGYDISLQFFVDETSTPIEAPQVVWSEAVAPPVSVATLTLDSIAAPASVEELAFDPWGGLDAHRPLGEVMRARRVAYRASQLARLGS